MRPKAFSYVRISTDQQQHGDGVRRQAEASRKYAEEHDLDLVESLEDIGVSAFRGVNRSKGSLSDFLRLVDEQHIPRGSYLIVESLDRLSREAVLHSLGLLMALLSSGITVVTLSDGKIYDEKANELDLLYSLFIMSRSHEESKTKSMRVAASWQQRRKQLHEKPITSICPAWLRLDKESKQFVVIPERVAVVERIFQESIEGLGGYTIAKRLNLEGIQPFSKNGNGWHESSVQKIRRNQAVLGYLPINGKKLADMPFDETTKGYYPQIISEDIYFKAQAIAKARRTKAGRKGKRFSNLFQGLARCGICGSVMILETKAGRKKKYLACDSVIRGLGCNHSVRHSATVLEKALFDDFFSSLDLSVLSVRKISPADAARDKVNRLRVELEANEHKIGGLLESFDASSPSSAITSFIKQLDEKIMDIKAALVSAEEEYRMSQHASVSLQERVANLAQLIERLNSAEENEVYLLRSAINSQLKNTYQKIEFFPDRSVRLFFEENAYQELWLSTKGVRMYLFKYGEP